MKSYEQMQKTQALLTEVVTNLEKEYFQIRNECMKEIMKDKQDEITQKNEMHSLYEKLANNMSMSIKWIKRKLPWYIASFFKIRATEIRLVGNSIFIGVNFGSSNHPNCYIEINPTDIGW